MRESTINKISPLVRAIGVFSAVAIVVGGVTFAALNSQATLTDSSYSTANAALKIWDGDSFEATAPGFDVNNLVPGQYSEEKFVYLQNASEVDLYLSAKVTGSPVLEGVVPTDVDVRFTGYAPGCSDDAVETTLAAMQAGPVELPCDRFGAGQQGNTAVEETEGNYSIAVRIADTVSDAGATIDGLDIEFNGSVVAPVPES